MFYCQSCKKLSQPGEKPHRVVSQTRPKTYTAKREGKDITLGHGREIVRELSVCVSCVPKDQAK